MSDAIPLKFPITVDGETYTSLTMRRPKVRDTQDARKKHTDEFDRGIFMLSRLCGVSPEHIAELDESDAEALQARYESFRA